MSCKLTRLSLCVVFSSYKQKQCLRIDGSQFKTVQKKVLSLGEWIVFSRSLSESLTFAKLISVRQRHSRYPEEGRSWTILSASINRYHGGLNWIWRITKEFRNLSSAATPRNRARRSPYLGGQVRTVFQLSRQELPPVVPVLQRQRCFGGGGCGVCDCIWRRFVLNNTVATPLLTEEARRPAATSTTPPLSTLPNRSCPYKHSYLRSSMPQATLRQEDLGIMTGTVPIPFLPVSLSALLMLRSR